MRSIFIALLAVISPLFLSAQPDTPSVPNSVGFDLPMGNSSMTISIGEPMISTLTSGSSVITQGYLQPIDKAPCTGVDFTYYPNPASEYLIVEANGCDDQIHSVQIIDIWGRVIDTLSPKSDNRIPLTDLSQGLYVFKVVLNDGTAGSFSAVKLPN